MKATVILPCYNSESTLGEMMDSLARQEWRDDWEFILADNGSTDRSVEIVNSYSDVIPNIRILNVYSGQGEREPASASYNKAFAAAKGDVFITCESDDVVADGWLVSMYEALKTEDFVGPVIDDQLLNAKDLVGSKNGFQTLKTGFPNSSGPLNLPYPVGCSIGMSRKLWETVGDFDTHIGHLWDIDYGWRAQLAGFDLVMVPDALIYYRQRDTIRARYKQGRMYGKCSAKIAAKYGGRPLRYIAYNLYHLTMSSLTFAFSILPGTSSPRYTVWRVANAIGQLQGFGHVLQGRRDVLEIPERLRPLTLRQS